METSQSHAQPKKPSLKQAISAFLENTEIAISRPPPTDPCAFSMMNRSRTSFKYSQAERCDQAEHVSDEWKDIYEDREHIVREEQANIFKGFCQTKTRSSSHSPEYLRNLAHTQAQILYEMMLHSNLEQHIKNLEDAIRRTKSRLIPELRLKESLKQKRRSADHKNISEEENGKIVDRCLELLKRP